MAAYQFESKDRYLTGVYARLADKGCSVSKPITYAREHTDTSRPGQMLCNPYFNFTPTCLKPYQL